MENLTVIQSPKRVFLLCLMVFIIWILASGYVFQTYRLFVLETEVSERLKQVRADMDELEIQLSRLKDREFIRKQAIENLGLAGQQDLIFLFPQ
jgi:cell division protein FtsB